MWNFHAKIAYGNKTNLYEAVFLNSKREQNRQITQLALLRNFVFIIVVV